MTSPTPQSPRLNSLVQTLAEAYLERGQFAEAADGFGELVRSGLQTPNVYRNLALALLGLESLTNAAQQVYQYVLNNFPNDREICVQICRLLLKHKAQDTFALKCFQQTLALNPPPQREVQWALAAHLQDLGYAPAAFEILKRLALRENGNEAQTLARMTQLATQLGKQNEARNMLLYFAGRNERALGPSSAFLALDYAQTFLRQDDAHSLSTREWQTITQVALSYQRLENLTAAREYATLRLALARMQSRNAQRHPTPRVVRPEFHVADFLQRLPPPSGNSSAPPSTAIKYVYGLRLCNLAQISAESGETLARNLAQKFIDFTLKYLGKAAQAACYPLADGLLAFSDALEMLALSAVEVLQKIERYNLTAAKGARLFAYTVVHAAPVTAPNFEHEGMQTLFEALHLLEAKIASETPQGEWSSRLLFSRNVYEQDLAHASIPAKALGFVQSLGAEFQCEVYEAVWRNPLEYVEEKTPYDLGRFVVTVKLRGGRTCGTYRGRDRQLERNAVIKALSPYLSAQLAEDTTLREHVVASIRKIAKLESPGIATIYDMGFHEDIFFYAREYLEGLSLAETLQGGRGFTFAESVKLGMRACRILSVAHRHGVWHGNLKPANIWLFPNEDLKLSDFHVPGFVEKPDPAPRRDPASWHYAAPELFHSFVPNMQSDIYALGILLYELVSGTTPFAEITSVLEWQAHDLPPLSTLWPDAPAGFSETLARAYAKNPEQRFQNLIAFENALRMFTLQAA